MSAATDVPALSRASAMPLGAFRQEHVAERVRRALERERVPDAPALAALLRRDPEARERFRRSVAVSVSGLFRDRGQFEFLEREVLPDVLAAGRRVTVWSAGCADGSELYSVGLILERMGALDRARLLGSDLLAENLRVARRGVYGDFEVPAGLRGRARWEVRDLAGGGAPAGPWELVLCRNTAIYLDRPARAALNEALAGSLSRSGTLVLGRSERLADPAALGLERMAPHVYRRAP